MKKLKLMVLSSLIAVFFLSGCDGQKSASKLPHYKELTIYSGITMVRPLKQLAQQYETLHPDIKINIIQGASGYLLKTLKKAQSGDIYFPGSDSYRLKNQSLGIFKNHVFVGYNQIAMIVAKGNPKRITNDLLNLTDPTYSVVLAAPNSGSIGRFTKKVLDKLRITEQVYQNITYFTTDSHRLSTAILSGDADVTLNWYATVKWPENKNKMQVILLDGYIAAPKKLELNLLSFSKYPKEAIDFMTFCGSKKGLTVFYENGFMTDSQYQQAIEKKVN